MTDLDRAPVQPVPLPGRIGQGTVVEQSRAVAEVLGRIRVAQELPRDTQKAVRQMRESCAQRGLAERATYAFPRAGQTVAGPSVHLARELARVWGNVDYGIVEMRRDDAAKQSEMMAFAWDIETNTRSTSTFIVPHLRDIKNSAPKPLVDMRDIYENNTNAAARRLREAIFSILPPWFIEDAKELCAATLKHGGGIPLAQRIAKAIHSFGEIGVTQDQLEQHVGQPAAKWNDFQTANLGVLGRSISQGTITIDEAFPQQRVTADEITSASSRKPRKAAERPARSAARPEPQDAPPAAQDEPRDPAEPSDAEWDRMQGGGQDG